MDQGMKYASYTQISPERDVTGTSFSKGQINFRINLDSMSRWNPYRSYLRMRLRLTDENGDTLAPNSRIGPSMFQGDCFWQQMNLACNGVKVSQIDDYYIQVAALKQRMLYDQSRRDTMLADTNFGQASLKDRLAQVRRSGFEGGDPGWESFFDLHQFDADFVADDDEMKVVAGTLRTIRYRTTGDGGAGTIDLTESALQVGDYIKIVEDTQPQEGYTIRRVVSVTADTIVVDEDLVAFAATTIAVAGTNGTLVYFSKKPPSRRVREYELIFKPRLGFFDIDEFLPGNFQLEITPWKDGQWNKFAIEGLVNDAAGEYELTVLDLQLYAYTGIATSRVNGTKRFEFSETRCQAQTITNRTLMNKAFVVNKDSHMYTIAFQAGNAGDEINLPRTKYVCDSHYEQNIKRYQLRCGGYTLPTPLPDISKEDNVDLSTQQYFEELMYTKTAYLADPESLTEWYERGPFYAYRMPKPIDNPSNRLYVSCEFSAPEGDFKNFSLLVFDTFYTGFSMTLDNGIVTKTTRNVMLN